MSDSRRLAGGSAARAIRFNDKLAGPPEPTHCQNGSRRCVYKNGVICKIMLVLQPWTHMDTDFPMTLYENQFIRSYGNLCPPASSVSKGYPVSTAKSGFSSTPFHPRTPPRFSGSYPRRASPSVNRFFPISRSALASHHRVCGIQITRRRPPFTAAGVNVALRIGVVESFFDFSLACLFVPLIYPLNSDGSACSGSRHGVCLTVRTLCHVGSAIGGDAMSDGCQAATEPAML